MERLRELRKEKGISLKELGVAIGVAESTMSLYENGKRQPDYETLLKFAEYFNVSVDYLIGKSEFKNNTEFAKYYEAWGVSDTYFDAPFDFCGLLKDIREDQGVSVSEMAEVIGVTPQEYSDCEDGINPITHEQAEKLCEYLGTNTSQVFFDNNYYDEEVPEAYHNDVRKWELLKQQDELDRIVSSMYPDFVKGKNYLPSGKCMDISDYNLLEKYHGLDDYGKDVVDTVLDKELARTTEQRKRHTNVIELNFIDAPVSAGLGDMLEDYENSEKVFVPLNSESRRADFILKIYGDSMEPKFSDGDYVLVRQQPTVDKGQIGIFGYDGKGYVKKFGGDRLISLNKKYSDIYIDESARCFGLVLGTTSIIDG